MTSENNPTAFVDWEPPTARAEAAAAQAARLAARLRELGENPDIL